MNIKQMLYTLWKRIQSKVDKSGDTMTGQLRMAEGEYDDRTFTVEVNNNGKNANVGWSYPNIDGAGAFFRSSDWDGVQQGGFGFYARSGDGSNEKILEGRTNGDLMWNGKHVFTTDAKWTDDMQTNNTSDTWVPVWKDKTMQHRVIPRNIIETRQADVNINKAFGSKVLITAPDVTSFTFVAWVAVETIGWVGSCYVTSAVGKTAQIFNASTDQSGTGRVIATALYKANF